MKYLDLNKIFGLVVVFIVGIMVATLTTRLDFFTVGLDSGQVDDMYNAVVGVFIFFGLLMFFIGDRLNRL